MQRFGQRTPELTWSTERPSPHDLRRTLATGLARLGVPAEDVSACLNHVRRDVTRVHYDVYDRAREKRVAFERWSQHIGALLAKACDRSAERVEGFNEAA